MRSRTSRRGRTGAVVVLLLGAFLVSQVGAAGAARLVTGRQVKDESVTGRDLRNGSVTGLDVADRRLSARDLTPDLRGEPGPAGPAGPPGPAGPEGFDAAREIYRVVQYGPVAAPGSYTGATAACPRGKRALSGGFSTQNPDAQVEMVLSAPLSDGRGWVSSYRNTGSVSFTGYVWAVCAYVL